MGLPSFEKTFEGIRLPVDSFFRALKVYEAGLVPNPKLPDLVLPEPIEGVTSISLTVDGGKWTVTESEFIRRYATADEGSYFRSIFLHKGGDLNIGLWFTGKFTRILLVGISEEQVAATASLLLAAASQQAEELTKEKVSSSSEKGKHCIMTPNPRDVMVIYGRDSGARKATFDFLRALDLRPLEWNELVHRSGSGTPLIGNVLDVAFETAQAALVVLSGDDEARLRIPLHGSRELGYETSLTRQARPNVLFEAGMAFGRYPERTILISLGSLRPFSDVSGRHVVHMSNGLEARHSLMSRLRSCGCAVAESGSDWHTAGDFKGGPTHPIGEFKNLAPQSWFGIDEREGVRMVVCVSRWPDDKKWFWLRIQVAAADPVTQPLRGRVKFIVHPDFGEREMIVPVILGEAVLTLQTEGPWKVRAEAGALLEVDLSKLGVPWS